MDFVAAVVADEQSFVVVQPGEGALDDPANATESGAVLGLATSDLGFDVAGAEFAAVLVVVVAAVGGNPLGASPWPADPAAYRRDAIDERQQLRDVVAVAARDRPGKRDPGRVDEKVMLGAVSGPVNRARARRGAPLAECAERRQAGGARLVELGGLVAARGSSLSLVHGLWAGDMMVDGGSRGRAVCGRSVFCGQRCAGARARQGALGSGPEA